MRAILLLLFLFTSLNAGAMQTCKGTAGELYHLTIATNKGTTPEIVLTREEGNHTWTMSDDTGYATLTMLSHTLENQDDAHLAVFSKLYLSELIKFNNQMQPGDPNKEIVMKMIYDIAKRPPTAPGRPMAQITQADLKTFLTKIYPKYPARHFPTTLSGPRIPDMKQDKPLKDVLPLGFFGGCQTINAYLIEPHALTGGAQSGPQGGKK